MKKRIRDEDSRRAISFPEDGEEESARAARRRDKSRRLVPGANDRSMRNRYNPRRVLGGGGDRAGHLRACVHGGWLITRSLRVSLAWPARSPAYNAWSSFSQATHDHGDPAFLLSLSLSVSSVYPLPLLLLSSSYAPCPLDIARVPPLRKRGRIPAFFFARRFLVADHRVSWCYFIFTRRSLYIVEKYQT